MLSHLLLFLLTFSIRAASAEEGQKFKPRLSIKLSGGLSYFNIGDINNYLKTYDNYLSVMTHYEGGETKTFNYIYDLEGEFRLDIGSKFALSAGIGYISGKNKSYFEYTGPFPFQVAYENNQKYFIKHEVEVIPLLFGIHYKLPVSQRTNIFVNSGIGFYFSKDFLYKCHWSSAVGQWPVIYTKEEIYDVSSSGLGLRGGIGFEYGIANNLAFVLEIQGRYARIGNLKGTRFYSLTFLADQGKEEGGTLYIGERDMTDEGYGESCPDLIISSTKPVGDEFKNVRKAILDFSGMSLRAGVRIGLWPTFFTKNIQIEERPNFIQKFSIKMDTGLSCLAVGDINTFLEDANEWHLDRAQYFNGLKKGELKKIRFGSDSEIEVTYDLTSRLRIGFGTGYIYGRRGSSVGHEVSPPGFYGVDFTFSPRINISAVSLKSGVYYVIPFSTKARLFINGGIGYYFAKNNFSWKEREIWTREDGSTVVDWREKAGWDLNSKGIGYHGGFGFEYNFAKNLAIVIGAQGRHARIKKLRGDEIYVGQYNVDPQKHYYGAVYYYEEKDVITEKYYSRLAFYREKPDYPDYKNIRDAELDFSGFSLKIGIRIRLF